MRHVGTTMIDDVLLCDYAGVFLKMYESAGCLARAIVGFSHHSGFGNPGMTVQHVLDFNGGGILTATDDDVLGAVL